MPSRIDAATRARRAAVNVVIADQNRLLVRGLRDGLRESGYDDVEPLDTCEALVQRLASRNVDLLITGTKLADGDTTDTVRAVRHGELGSNPFLAIILTSYEAGADTVRRVVDSGVDDFLLAPLSVSDLTRRIDILVKARKPFVVTSDYIGPDRRKDPGRVSNAPTFEPPNTLRSKEQGEAISAAEQQASIDKVKAEMNEERLRRVGFQIAFLVDMMAPAMATGSVGDEFAGHAARLVQMAEEAVQRLTGTRFEAAGELCRTMATVARAIRSQGAGASARDTALLVPLSKALLKTFHPEAGDTALAAQISGAVGTYKARQGGGTSG